ncbi:MAG: HPr(Ser) kinase/phosphatase [Gammaproteobacteria bacterium]|nr:MAG: HPr(Ser) kinase/phosphatase [Gammaproteobacteria bacterium]
MAADLTVRDLYAQHRDDLSFEWIAGYAGADRSVSTEKDEPFPRALVGHLNLVRCHRVQVVGHEECDHLSRIEAEACEEMLRGLFDSHPACVIVADGIQPNDALKLHADRTETALLRTERPSRQVVGDLQYSLSRTLARQMTVHGVFMEVLGVGVLVTGKSGVGKSELALDLVSRGHRLVADDVVELALIAPDILEGRCPASIVDFMEVRGLGIVNVRALFGDSAVGTHKYLRLIINLETVDPQEISALDRLEGIHRTRNILDVEVPEVTLPVAPGRGLAVLTECTVRNHILRMKGYDPARDFVEKQNRLMQRDSA